MRKWLRKRRVLRLVNLARWVDGRRKLKCLPRGVRHSAESCTLARALNGNVSIAYVRVIGWVYPRCVADAWGTRVLDDNDSAIGGLRIQLPLALQMFALDFDAGRYPELEVAR